MCSVNRTGHRNSHISTAKDSGVLWLYQIKLCASLVSVEVSISLFSVQNPRPVCSPHLQLCNLSTVLVQRMMALLFVDCHWQVIPVYFFFQSFLLQRLYSEQMHEMSGRVSHYLTLVEL